MSRKKILIPIGMNHGVRNFIESGAFDALEKEFDLHFLVSSSVQRPLNKPHFTTVSDAGVAKRAHKRWRSFYISMKRYQKRCTTFPVKYRETFYSRVPRRQQIIADIVTLPIIAETFMGLNEWLLGTERGIDEAISAVNPDFLLIPFAFNDDFSLDCLKVARKKKIKNLALMFNWDNVSSKGVLPFNPDYLAVWGQQTLEHAMDIQKMPSDRVFILGVPQFEDYRKPVGIDREAFRKAQGLPLDKTVILVTGASRFVDETALLQRLEEAVTDGRLQNAHICYRPHPWRTYYTWEKDFFACDFKHVTMDPQMSENYRLRKNAVDIKERQSKAFVPSYDYYPSLINAVDAVMTMGSTMGLEAMMMGKPIMVKAYPEDIPDTSHHHNVWYYAHHACWWKMKSVIVCDKKENFIDDCRRFLDMSRRGGIKELVKEDLQYVVYNDERPYAERLKQCVEGLMSGAIR